MAKGDARWIHFKGFKEIGSKRLLTRIKWYAGKLGQHFEILSAWDVRYDYVYT